MRQPGDEPEPFDPRWWADWQRRCDELTAAEIESMSPPQTGKDRPGRRFGAFSTGRPEARP